MFFGTGFAGRVPAHISFRISFYLVFGTKNKNKKTASHGCAEIPAGIPAGIPQLTGRWQNKKKVCAPLCRPPKARWRFRTAGPLDIYIYVFDICLTHLCIVGIIYVHLICFAY